MQAAGYLILAGISAKGGFFSHTAFPGECEWYAVKKADAAYHTPAVLSLTKSVLPRTQKPER